MLKNLARRIELCSIRKSTRCSNPCSNPNLKSGHSTSTALPLTELSPAELPELGIPEQKARACAPSSQEPPTMARI